MRRTLPSVLAMALALSACTSLREAGPPATAEADLSHQILLTVRQDSDVAIGLRGAPEQRYQYRRSYGPSPSAERTLQRIAREHGLKRVRGWPIASLDVYCEVLEVPADRDVAVILEALAEHPDIDIAQPMNTFRALLMEYDDPYVDLQKSVVSLDIRSAHMLATGKGVLVALIDSGVDRAHPELRERVRLQRDLVDQRVFGTRGEVHGTAVAGVIASAANNAVGIVGVAPGADIAGLRACWTLEDEPDAAVCSSFSLAQAIEAALEIRPDVINMSLAGPDDPLVARLLDEALADGIVVVAARGDDPGLPFPASHDGVIAASRETADAGIAGVLKAPSREVLTTTLNNDYGFFSGSSLAAAHVTGVVALMLERFPNMTHDELASILRATTDADGERHLINACRALAMRMPQASCAQ